MRIVTVRRVRTSIMVSEEIFRNMRIYANKRGQDISAFAEEALREKIQQCKEIEKIQQEMTELRATIDVSRKLYQQIKQKPDFNSTMSEDFIKTIISGVDPKHHDIVIKGITEEDKNKVEQSITRALEALISGKKSEQSKLQQQNQPRQQEQEQK